MTSSSGSSLISGIYSGLTNTYSYLAAQYSDGVTLDNINAARSDATKANYLNNSFASYLQNNFASIDKDKDGVISSEEMTNLTNRISTQGITKAELTQIYSSGTSGLSSSTVENILNHFDEMDTNHDGRITSEEISGYTLNANKEKMIDEENAKKAANMSVFYANEDATPDTYSILSYRYKDITKNNS